RVEDSVMPIHDWTRVPAGLFHDFHQSWSIRIKDDLNAGRLPKGLSALVEQRSGAWEPDVLAIERRTKSKSPKAGEGGGLRWDRRTDSLSRGTKKRFSPGHWNGFVFNPPSGGFGASMKFVPPDNKASRAAINDFLQKTIAFLRKGVHVLIVDLFPPTPRDPL